MNVIKGALAAAIGAAGAAVAGGVLAARYRGKPGGEEPHWHVLTVYKPLNEMHAARLPAPLEQLGDVIQVQLRPAPGDRGTEIAARLRDGEPSRLAVVAGKITDRDPRYAVRRALREAKSLIETGEVLNPDSHPSHRRTVLNRPLEYAARHGREEGLL
jgi:hypothetical protein